MCVCMNYDIFYAIPNNFTISNVVSIGSNEQKYWSRKFIEKKFIILKIFSIISWL